MTNDRLRLWAPDDLLGAYAAWQAGWGDLPFVAHRRPVPPTVRLGVLAHAPWRRLEHLRSAGRWSRPAATWGPDGLLLVARVLDRAASPAGLTDLQRNALQPLERQLLDAGRMDLGGAELAARLAPVLSPQPAERTG
jgi:hypothetical protein